METEIIAILFGSFLLLLLIGALVSAFVLIINTAYYKRNRITLAP